MLCLENQETQDYANGAKYIGQKQNGLRHGRGKMLFEDGCIYEGEWECNQMSGQGIHYTPHIPGILFYPSGQVAYQGQWSHDQFNGSGTFYYESPQLLKATLDYKDLS